jgi:hypothetical protein
MEFSMIARIALAAGVLAATLTGPALAQEKQALTPGIVEQLDIVSKLTNYGIERKDPLLLLAAARLVTTIAPEAAASTGALGADELIAKAKELGGGKAEIGTLADDIASESSRGLCHGPGTVYGCF